MSVTPEQILDLIKKLPDSDAHIHKDGERWCVTNEWFAGGFGGRAFHGATREEAAQKLIEYIDGHISHKSFVGSKVGKMGWPNLKMVYEYCKPNEEVLDDVA